MAPDGLRYTSKTPGSPFASLNSVSLNTMSCFLCGRHQPRNTLKSRKLAGKSHLVCDPNCHLLPDGTPRS